MDRDNLALPLPLENFSHGYLARGTSAAAKQKPIFMGFGPIAACPSKTQLSNTVYTLATSWATAVLPPQWIAGCLGKE
jgi:hypothetical protein